MLRKRKFKVNKDSRHTLPFVEKLLGQQFTLTAPDQACVTDIMYISTGEGWLYLAGHKDLLMGEVVG